MLCSSYEHEYSVFVKFVRNVTMVFVTNKIAERLYEDFLFVDFYENFIYSVEDYFYSYEDYFCSAEDFLGARRFSRRTKIFFLFGYFHEHFLNLAEQNFYSCFFKNIRFYFPKKNFIRAKIFC